MIKKPQTRKITRHFQNAVRVAGLIITSALIGLYVQHSVHEKEMGESLVHTEKDGRLFQFFNMHAEGLKSFRDILRTGDTWDNGLYDPLIYFYEPEYTVKWGKKDQFNAAFEKAYDNSLKHIQKSITLHSLLSKNEWQREDRERWEETLAQIVSYEAFNAGFEPYRSGGDDSTLKRDTDLNKIGEDIANNQQQYEYDCEAMSLVEGCLIQRLEDKLLPAAAKPSMALINTATESDDYKTASAYYYSKGFVPGGKHAWITSGKTGHVIEATDEIPFSDYIYLRQFQTQYATPPQIRNRTIQYMYEL